MTYAFKVYYQIDSEVPGDSGMRSRVRYIDAETEAEAEDYAIEKFSEDQDYVGCELIQ